MYYGGFTYTEAYALPVSYKRWYIERISKEIKGSQEDPDKPGNGNSRAPHHNTPDVAALQGKSRTQVPARNRRFT